VINEIKYNDRVQPNSGSDPSIIYSMAKVNMEEKHSMKRTWLNLPLLLAAFLIAFAGNLPAKPKEGTGDLNRPQRHFLSKGQSTTRRTLINVGAVAGWIYSDGISFITPSGSSGGAFPRAANPPIAVIYTDGMVWGGKVNDGSDPIIRVGGQTYSTGTVPGAILSKGVAEDINDRINVDRVWRIRRDYPNVNLTQDAAEFNEIFAADVTPAHVSTLRALYRLDWVDWPVEKGAPFYDADGDGVYTPEFYLDSEGVEFPKTLNGVDLDGDGTPDPITIGDEPGVAGADQVVWLVANDLDEGTVTGLYGSPSIGIEMQLTLWGYNRSDALGNIVFKQFRMIYKGATSTPANAVVDSFFVCQWSDPDNGTFTNDFAGSDTLSSLGFAYDSNTNDPDFAAAGFTAAASGYDFFAGPLVEDPAGTAIFGLEKRPGYRNLPMTSFGYFYPGGPATDPSLGGDYETGTLEWWNLLRGFMPQPGTAQIPWVNPVTNQVTKFTLTGDPVANTGWIDTNPGDRRILLASGPVTFALGDTQEVVVAMMAAMGSSRLSSVDYLKFVDSFAQETFDNLFVVPKPPPAPIVAVSEYDGEILLDWGADGGGLAATEGYKDQSFIFEGYNVYQFNRARASLDQGIKLASYDVSNEVTTISQKTFDIGSGLVLELPVQFGTNSGLARSLTLDRDQIRELNLVNGQTYYFGVTAYGFNTRPDATLKTLESSPTIVTVVPQTTKPGDRYNTAISDVVETEHVDGSSDGNVVVNIVDMAKVTGSNYEVTFSDSLYSEWEISDEGDSTEVVFVLPVWHLRNTSSGKLVLANQTNQSGDADYLAKDGFLATVTGAPEDYKFLTVVANANGALDPPDMGAFGFNNNGFPFFNGEDRPSGRQQANGSRWGIQSTSAADASYGNFLARTTQYSGGAGESDQGIASLVGREYEIRFTAAGGRGYFNWSTLTVEDVPFELWDLGPDASDTSDDYRLFPWILDFNGDGLFNFGPDDHSVSGGSNDPFTDGIYWLMPLDTSPGEAGYNALVAAHEADGVYPNENSLWALKDTSPGWNCKPGFMRMVFANWNGGDVTDPTFPANVNAQLPEQGTIFRITMTKPNTSLDRFTFSTVGLEKSSSAQLANSDIAELANVFPNPYYGINAFEGNRFERYVTFSHLPEKAIIRVFNLAGTLVRVIEKDDPAQFTTWNLKNEDGLPVASGLYIAHLEFPGLSVTKNLKLFIAQEQQFLRAF